ncbi:hypothetical protein [Corynebacterium ulcerans]|uniref:hypothetical protein n=1 Tax=Corynebacterium ulcerans TaxID=65058 RepID=UPI000C75BE61|nr:hypothetical protein [Corynebacterium ulcerans]
MVSANPPSSTWVPPAVVTGEIISWLNLALFVVSGLSILALMLFGALLVLDRDRGEPISATAPQVRALQIIIGVIIFSSAGTLATWLAS